MTISKTLLADLEFIGESIFKPCGLEMRNVEIELESKDYAAHSFSLGGKKILFRKAKITPVKTGQFVTLWKRNQNGETAPFDISDDFDFYLVAVRKAKRLGLFIFSKFIFYQYGVLSGKAQNGKRGIRVYTTWDKTMNAPSQKTQLWQRECFLEITNKADLAKVKELLGE